MKKVAFISDFFREDLPGGAESNDKNLINFLASTCDIKKFHSKSASPEDLANMDFIIISNFIMLNQQSYEFIIQEKGYIIYEHDHKYVSNRDPSKFYDFKAPQENVVNKEFYEKADCVVVLSEICKEVLLKNINKANVHNIGCSLWSESTFDFLRKNSMLEKTKDLCIMKNANPTKNYHKTVEFCAQKEIVFGEIQSDNYLEFLTQMSEYKRFLFIPSVLETYSRICAEAKMMNVDVMTNKKMIGFFSEEYSHLKGAELIDCIRQKNEEALAFFGRNI